MARSFFYYGSIRKTIIQFLDIFNNLSIAKYDTDGTTILKNVQVPIKYMPKEKFYYWINSKKKHEKRFPIMGVELTSVEFDVNRQAGAQENLVVTSDDDKTSYISKPVPYNIGFTVHIGTEYTYEQDQINEQLLPFFTPYVYTKVKIDELNAEWDAQVILNSSNVENDTDIAADDYRSIIWTHDFTVKTNLVKPTFDIKNVHKIVNKFYLDENSWNARNDSEMPSGAGEEQEELLVLGSKKDAEILAQYLVF